MLLESIRDWAFDEVREVKRAPVAIILLLAFGLVVGWWMAYQFYAERIEVLRLQISALERGIAAVRPIQALSETAAPSAFWWLLTVFGIAISIAAITSALRNKRLVTELGEQAATSTALAAAITVERDTVTKTLKETKIDYALDTLRRYSHYAFKDGEQTVKPTVTVRFCDYSGDDKLAQRIKEIFTEYTGWQVELDGQNKPPLLRADKFKVVFDVGMTVMTYGDLVYAFQQGELLGPGVTIGQLKFGRDETKHLIVSVLPSAAS